MLQLHWCRATFPARVLPRIHPSCASCYHTCASFYQQTYIFSRHDPLPVITIAKYRHLEYWDAIFSAIAMTLSHTLRTCAFSFFPYIHPSLHRVTSKDGTSLPIFPSGFSIMKTINIQQWKSKIRTLGLKCCAYSNIYSLTYSAKDIRAQR